MNSSDTKTPLEWSVNIDNNTCFLMSVLEHNVNLIMVSSLEETAHSAASIALKLSCIDLITRGLYPPYIML